MKPINLLAECRFRPDKFRPALLHGSPRARAFLLCLEPGQGLDPRPDSEEMLCCLLQGRAELTVAGETITLSPGDFASAPAGETRGLRAAERSILLYLHLSSGPASHD